MARTLFTPFLAASVSLAASSQAPAPREASPPPEVVRITLSLVQVDAVVTDKDGRHVTDLRAQDFEILEDGRPQEITNCAYISNPKHSVAVVSPAPNLPAVPPPPPTKLRPEQVRRTLALVVDDLGLSFRSTVEVRGALEKFVDEQMEPGDLVAIIRTGAGMGALQQFTADKRLLHAAIDRVRFNGALSRFGVAPVAPVGEFRNVLDTGGGPRGTKPAAGELVDALRESALTSATLGSVNFVINGLRDLPGRKGVVLFSDGLRLLQARSQGRPLLDPDPRIQGALGRLIDLANRASVVLYTIDTRGLVTLAFTAGDDVNKTPGTRTTEVQTGDFNDNRVARSRQLLDNQDGLQMMAEQTGGFLLRNQNDLSRSMGRVLEDQRGYYLIGYAPAPSTFNAERSQPSFHKIKVKVRRPGFSVRSRAGFYGVTDDQARGGPQDGTGQLINALASPFASGDVHLQLTSLFFHEPPTGSFMRSFLHVDARDLSLEKEADGSGKTQIEILAVTFGDNGVVVDQIGRSQALRVMPQLYETALQRGLDFTINVPVKKPGGYQLRVAIRDVASGRVGSANQFVDVPDLKQKRLALSGILMKGVGPSPPPAAVGGTGEGWVGEEGREATEAVRRFRPGRPLSYGFVIYNAQLDRATGQPKLEAQMRLFRDGQPLKIGEVRKVALDGQKDTSSVATGGILLLGPEMRAGDYVLQVAVTDTLARSKHRTATQTIDFEVEQ